MARNNASRRNANQKSVLRTATVRNAFMSTFKGMACVVVALLSTMFFVGCAKEQVNPKPAAVGPAVTDSIKEMTDHWDKSVKSLIVNATPHDTLCYSWVAFEMNSQMKYSTQDGVLYSMNFAPEASLNVRLTPARQEVASELELPTYRTKRETVYDTPINEGLYLGRKFKLRDTQADGSITEIEATWRCLGIITAEGDTVLPPHIEFDKNIVLDSIHVEKFGEQTELDKPHKLVHCYTASYTSKGITGGEKTMKVQMRPWRIKSITDEPQIKTGEPTYDIKWEGCPVSKLNLTQTTPTNKGNVVVKESFDVVFNVSVPEAREQASLDSLFAKTSTGELKYAAIGDTVKHANGFQSLNFAGGYTSRNKGTENGSNIETTATITASMPVKFENKWGSVDIKPLEPSFEEGGFAISSLSQDADYHLFKSVNTIIPHLGDCTLDVLDEVVNLKVAKDKAEIWVDSVFVKKGNGDKYTVDGTFYGSKGSKRELTWTYDGRHSASAKNFGEKITSSLNWSASALKDNGSSKENDEKVFSPMTKFVAVYTTTNKKSDASNGVESGEFGFSETHPVVTFIHGDTKITFDERKVVLSGKGAQPAANYTLTVKDGISYKGYTYNMSAGVIFDGVEEADVTSQGLLLMIADEVGETTYKDEYVWAGNTLTATVTKTTPHSFADDEVETYQKSVTVSMGDLEDGKVNAENVNFTVTPSNSEKSDEVKDGVWTITKRVRNINYLVSNGAVKREMNHEIVDYVLVFNDGAHTANFDGKLNVTNSDKFGTAYNDGDYQVTPLTTTVKAIANGTGAPTLSVDGVTSIYIEQDKVGETTYKAEESWSGNTFTAKVTRTTKHTKAQDEVKEFTKSVTVSMSNLSDDKVYAANTNFGTTSTDKENSSEDKDGQWTIKNFSREYTYVVSNGAVKREMNNNVKDAEIVFSEGGYTHTFNARLTVSSSDKFGSAKTEGDYTVTPLTTTVKAVGSGNNAPSLSTKGVTSIYVENPKEISYRFTYKVDEIDKGKVYADMLAERLVNGKVEKSWSCWGLAGMFGEYKPDVEGIWVTNTKFRDNYSTTNHDTDPGAKDLGDAKAFERENVSKIENHLSVLFDANPDADGNTTREVAGHINLWSYRYTFVDPDNGHKETLDFTVTCKTTTHTVKDGIYTRVVEILLNGEKVDTQTGKVNVTVQ